MLNRICKLQKSEHVVKTRRMTVDNGEMLECGQIEFAFLNTTAQNGFRATIENTRPAVSRKTALFLTTKNRDNCQWRARKNLTADRLHAFFEGFDFSRVEE